MIAGVVLAIFPDQLNFSFDVNADLSCCFAICGMRETRVLKKC